MTKQLYFLDTGLLIDAEREEADYLADSDWDPTVMGIADTGQIFDPLSQPVGGPATGRSPQRETWFYFPTLNKFHQLTRDKHSIEAAMETIFGATRAQEIIDFCERFGPWRETLDKLNMTKAKRKVQAAVDAGHITAQEAQLLRDLVVHIGG